MVLFSTFNLWLFGLIHQSSGQAVVVDYLAIFFAEYIQYVIALWFLVFLFYHRPYRKMALVAIVAAGIARVIVKPVILFFVVEPRPFVYFNITPLVRTTVGENLQSFPSGHALFFFALAMTVFLYHKRFGTVLFVAAILMGLSRVYTGVHWPLDIVFGAFVGMATGGLTYFTYQFGGAKMK